MSVRKHQDLEVEQSAMQFLDSMLIERFAKIDAAYTRAKWRARYRLSFEICHVSSVI